jgi:hypothetical protein
MAGIELENTSDDGRTTHENTPNTVYTLSPNSVSELYNSYVGDYTRYKRSHSNLGRILTITPSFSSLSVLDSKGSSDDHISDQGDQDDDDYADYIDLDSHDDEIQDFDENKADFDNRRDITLKNQSEIIKGEKGRGSSFNGNTNNFHTNEISKRRGCKDSSSKDKPVGSPKNGGFFSKISQFLHTGNERPPPLMFRVGSTAMTMNNLVYENMKRSRSDSIDKDKKA